MNDYKYKDFDLNKYYELLSNFDLDIYLMHSKDYIQDEMSFEDYLDYREKLSSKIHNLFLKDFDSLKDLLELAGTMNYFIGCLANRIAHESFFKKKHQKHLERNLVQDGESKIVFETDSQLTDTLYKFMDIFEKKFVMLGVIYQYKANILDNIEIDESYFINEFDELDFTQIKAFFKLYQEGELD